ncbi:MAG: hypothetical protein WBA57_27260 [Elainellaceae cyanobacterium]
MAHITLQLSDDLAERLAPFHDQLPELLERGLRSIIHEQTQDDRLPGSVVNEQQRLSTLATLHQLRSDIRATHGIYAGDLVAESRLERESCFEQHLESAS